MTTFGFIFIFSPKKVIHQTINNPTNVKQNGQRKEIHQYLHFFSNPWSDMKWETKNGIMFQIFHRVRFSNIISLTCLLIYRSNVLNCRFKFPFDSYNWVFAFFNFRYYPYNLFIFILTSSASCSVFNSNVAKFICAPTTSVFALSNIFTIF